MIVTATRAECDYHSRRALRCASREVLGRMRRIQDMAWGRSVTTLADGPMGSPSVLAAPSQWLAADIKATKAHACRAPAGAVKRCAVARMPARGIGGVGRGGADAWQHHRARTPVARPNQDDRDDSCWIAEVRGPAPTQSHVLELIISRNLVLSTM